MAENESWVPAEDARRLSDELHHWFRDRAEQEARLVAPKAIEYGSRSMVAQGRGLDALRGHPDSNPSDKEAFELAVWDMVRLKVGRWTEAVLHGKPVSDDTLLDIGIYVKMAQRNREAGSWPGVQLKAHPLDVTIVDDSTITNPHRTRTLNSEWRMEYRGSLNWGRYVLTQFDIVSKHTGETADQLVQLADPHTGYYNPDRLPDPKCSGWHNPEYGFCLRPASEAPEDIKIKPPIPVKEQ